MRPEWDRIWMEFAHSIARRSCDEKSKVGVVIVTDDNTQVLSVGYNGDHKGGSNTRESLEDGMSGFIHAEINALIKFNYNCPKKKIMYVTHSPCKMCAKAIINANINQVVFNIPFRDLSGVDLLKQFGVTIRQFNLE